MPNEIWTERRIMSALAQLHCPRTQDYYDAIEAISDAIIAEDDQAAIEIATTVGRNLKSEDPDSGTENFVLEQLDRTKPLVELAAWIVRRLSRLHAAFTRKRQFATDFGGSDDDSRPGGSDGSGGHNPPPSGAGNDRGNGRSVSETSDETKSFSDFFNDPLDDFRTDDETPQETVARNAADAESEYHPGPRRDDMEEELEVQLIGDGTRSDEAERERRAADRAATMSRNEAFFQELVRRAELGQSPEHHDELSETFDDVVNERVGSAMGRIERLARRVAETTSGLSQGVDLTERVQQLQSQIATAAVRSAERLLGGADPNEPDAGDMTHPVAIARVKQKEVAAEEAILRAAKARAVAMRDAGEIPNGVSIEEVTEAHRHEMRINQAEWTQELTELPDSISRNRQFLEVAGRAAQAAIDRNRRAAREAYGEAIDTARELVPNGMPPTAITERLVSNAIGQIVRTRRTQQTPQPATDQTNANCDTENDPMTDSTERARGKTLDHVAAQNALVEASVAGLLQRISTAIDVPDMAEAMRVAGALAMRSDAEKSQLAGKSARDIVEMVIKSKKAKRKRAPDTPDDKPKKDPRPPSGGTPPAGAATGSADTEQPRPAGTPAAAGGTDEPVYETVSQAGVELTRKLLKQTDWDNFCEIYSIRLKDRSPLLDTALAIVKKGADTTTALTAAKEFFVACKKQGGAKVQSGKHMLAAVEHAMVSRARGRRKLTKPLKASAVGEEEDVTV